MGKQPCCQQCLGLIALMLNFACWCRELTNGAEVVAARLEQVGRRQFVPPAFNPLARMKDTVVFGYLMASSKHGRVDVPDWYVGGLCHNPHDSVLSTVSPNQQLAHHARMSASANRPCQ